VSAVLLPGSGKTELAITYLSGAVRPEALDFRTPGFGILMTPLMGNVPARPGLHAHDNGVFTEMRTRGKQAFDRERFLRHLDLWRGVRHMALFAVAPDVIEPWQAARLGLASSTPWQATLERSAPLLPEIRRRGYRAALVAQNGLEEHLGEIPWADFDVLFIGGGPEARFACKGNRKGEWKWTAGAARLMAEARAQGKDVHAGRVNSLLRLRQAQDWGATSADGTLIAFGPDIRTPEVMGWLRTLNPGKRTRCTQCFICRWKAQAVVNTYGVERTSIDRILGDQTCDHQGVGPGTDFRPQAEQLLPLAA